MAAGWLWVLKMWLVGGNLLYRNFAKTNEMHIFKNRNWHEKEKVNNFVSVTKGLKKSNYSGRVYNNSNSLAF